MRIGIMGAGSIGCYLGGRLADAGHDVAMVGRGALVQEILSQGLTVTDKEGFAARLDPGRISVAATPEVLREAAVVLVTVKSQDTEEAARALAPWLGPETLVVSMQNGVRNTERLAALLPDRTVLGAMVPFNVLRKPGAVFHRGTSGAVIVGCTAEGVEVPLALALSASGVKTTRHPDIRGVQWGKLVLNLNNALNALAGIPLRRELESRGYRRILAALMDEALSVLASARIKPKASLGVPPRLVPSVLRLPDALFFKVAGTMLGVDPEARSSMWDDLARRRRTEIDYLNGEIVRLAAEHGGRAPLSAAIIELVREAEAAQAGSPGLSAEVLGERLGLASIPS